MMKKMVKAVVALSAAGFSEAEIAKLLRTEGGCEQLSKTTRNDEIERRYKGGETLESIGMDYGVTRQRIEQILKKRGVTSKNGGLVIRHLLDADEKVRQEKEVTERRDRKCFEKHGCTYEQFKEANKGFELYDRHRPICAFRRQRQSAKQRNIEWRLTFWQWWSIWKDSGKWAERGRGVGKYCMSRIGDSGPYSVENVAIITNEQNQSDSFLVHPNEARKKAQKETSRKNKAAELWRQGLSPSQIASAMNIATGTAAQYVNAAKRAAGVLQ